VAYRPNGFGNTQVVIDASGNPLMRTPKWTVNGSIAYNHETSAGAIGAFVSSSYNSGMTFDVGNRVRQDKYALLDAELSFAPAALPGLRIVAWGKNLTDHDYLQSVLESQLGDGGSYADPRTYGVRLEYTF
jgi:iron complex outermembrane receptor protein